MLTCTFSPESQVIQPFLLTNFIVTEQLLKTDLILAIDDYITIIFLKLPITLSISSLVVYLPRLNRTAPRPTSFETPIASKTGDMAVDPE